MEKRHAQDREKRQTQEIDSDSHRQVETATHKIPTERGNRRKKNETKHKTDTAATTANDPCARRPPRGEADTTPLCPQLPDNDGPPSQPEIK